MEAFKRHITSARAQSTADNYVRASRDFDAFLRERGQTYGDMTAGTMQDFADKLSATLQPRTVRTLMFGVRYYLKWLRGQGEEVADQSSITLPKLNKPERPFLDSAEVKTVLAEVRGWTDPSRIGVVLMMGSGVRISELVGLRLTDLKLKDGRIFLKVTGKGDKFRMVPVFKFVGPFLSTYLKHSRIPKSSPWLFPSTHKDGPITRRTVDRWVNRLRPLVGKRVHPHALRRTYSTMLTEGGASAFMVREVLGHSSVRTTQDYVGMTPNMMAAAIGKAEGAIDEQ